MTSKETYGDLGIYLQDQIKLLKNVTLTAGIRYDYSYFDIPIAFGTDESGGYLGICVLAESGESLMSFCPVLLAIQLEPIFQSAVVLEPICEENQSPRRRGRSSK